MPARQRYRLRNSPSARDADGLGQLLDVVSRIRVTERVAGVVEEVLSVNEGDRALDGRCGWHHEPQKNNPTEALRWVSRVRSDLSIGQPRSKIKRKVAVQRSCGCLKQRK
jgi:hypothetical protein